MAHDVLDNGICVDCPAGHRFNWGVRQNLVDCREHGSHNSWICACGQWIWRSEGAFVGEKPQCVNRESR